MKVKSLSLVSRVLLAAISVLAAFALSAPAAHAVDCANAGPTTDQYCPPPITPPEDPGQASSGLPFTGFDIGAALIAGILITGTGLALRRFASRENAA